MKDIFKYKILERIKNEYKTNQILKLSRESNKFYLELYRRDVTHWNTILKCEAYIGINGLTNDKVEGDRKDANRSLFYR